MSRSSPPAWENRSPSFATTRWSLVFSAGEGDGPRARAALTTLCETYWYPLYAFCRRRGHSADEALDLTQGFFSRLLEKRDFGNATPERGRFRAYLSAAMKNFIHNEWRRSQTAKRGGSATVLSFELEDAEERYRLEPADLDSPERQLDRAWAMVTLDLVMERLRKSYEDAGRGPLFQTIQGTLTGAETAPYAELATELGLKEGTVKVAVHRLRKRFRAELLSEIAGTVEDPDDVQEELHALFDALGS